MWFLGQCVTRLCARVSPRPAAQATDSSHTSRRTPAAPATAVVRGPRQGDWGADHLGEGAALHVRQRWGLGSGWRLRQSQSGGPVWPGCPQLLNSVFAPECDPDQCEAEVVPSCRQDQILLAGRLGDSCCTYYFCGGWTCQQRAACTLGLQPPPSSPLLPWAAGREGRGL